MLCFNSPSDANLFPVLYAITASYFSNIMIRLMLVISPALCILGGIAMSEIVKTTFEILVAPMKNMLAGFTDRRSTKGSVALFQKVCGMIVMTGMVWLMFMYAIHCTWVTS